MRAHEFLSESNIPADGSKFPEGQMNAIKGAVSFPSLSQNKSNSSLYMQWRFGIAMAGAPDYPTPPVGPMAGDPLLSTYTDVELEIINKAAASVGAGKINRLSNNRSEELSNTNKVSPINAFRGFSTEKKKTPSKRTK